MAGTELVEIFVLCGITVHVETDEIARRAVEQAERDRIFPRQRGGTRAGADALPGGAHHHEIVAMRVAGPVGIGKLGGVSDPLGPVTRGCIRTRIPVALKIRQTTINTALGQLDVFPRILSCSAVSRIANTGIIIIIGAGEQQSDVTVPATAQVTGIIEIIVVTFTGVYLTGHIGLSGNSVTIKI